MCGSIAASAFGSASSAMVFPMISSGVFPANSAAARLTKR
jgi:hypothetical protein